MDELNTQEQKQYGRRSNYIPPVRATYWSMRVMAGLGTLVFFVAALGAFLYRRKRLEQTRWFLWTGVVGISFPFVACRKSTLRRWTTGGTVSRSRSDGVNTETPVGVAK